MGTFLSGSQGGYKKQTTIVTEGAGHAATAMVPHAPHGQGYEHLGHIRQRRHCSLQASKTGITALNSALEAQIINFTYYP